MKRTLPAPIALAAILTSAVPTVAQQDQGMIVGRITDSTGGAIAGAVVTATAEQGASTHGRANAEGH